MGQQSHTPSFVKRIKKSTYSIRHFYPMVQTTVKIFWCRTLTRSLKVNPKDGEGKPSAITTLQVAPGSLTQRFGPLL